MATTKKPPLNSTFKERAAARSGGPATPPRPRHSVAEPLTYTIAGVPEPAAVTITGGRASGPPDDNVEVRHVQA